MTIPTPSISQLITREVLPGADAQSDDELLDYARSIGQTIWHTVGTCKMGTDGMAVVDPHLKVTGLRGLRVADASVIPFIVSANTNAAAYAVGEKCADLMSAEWND